MTRATRAKNTKKERPEEKRNTNEGILGEETDETIFAGILPLKTGKAPPKASQKRQLTLIDFNEESPEPKRAKKAKTTKSKTKKKELDSADIDALLMQTEGSVGGQNLSDKSDKENSPKKKSSKNDSKSKSTKSSKKTPKVTKSYTISSDSEEERQQLESRRALNTTSEESQTPTGSKTKRKAVTKKKTAVKKEVKKESVKVEPESDWSSDSDDDQPRKKSTKKSASGRISKEAENKPEAKVLEDGSIEISFKTDKKGNLPERRQMTEDEWLQKAIRAAINKDYVMTARAQHKIHLMCLVWMGMKWDSACDDSLLHAKILSQLPLKQKKPDSEKTLKTLLGLFQSLIQPLNASKHAVLKPTSGIPPPQKALLTLDQIVEGPTGLYYKSIMKSYGKYGYFLTSALLVACLRAVGLVTRLVFSFDVIYHKPQTKKQIQDRKKINDKIKNETSVWIEVHCGNKWLPILMQEKEFCIVETAEVEGLMKQPMSYAVAFDSGVRDVTARYAKDWLTSTKKLRLKYVEKNNENWWKDTCDKFPSRNNHLEAAENKNLSKKIISQDIPKTLTKLKGHPLYVAQRHILKYETIFPADTLPVAQVKIKDTHENVYERKYVRPLHTRNTWLQKAKVVRDGEVPCKMVASWFQNKKAGVASDTKNSPLFGEWQTDPYQPEIAKDGLVPRNNFGNVDLYQLCMLPIGCVYINDDDMDMGVFSRVCRKLNIDAPKAVIGFDGKKGYPVTQEGFEIEHIIDWLMLRMNIFKNHEKGYVICKENEEAARSAYYNQMGIDIEKREKERKARVKKRWIRAYRAVLIQKKVRRMFSLQQEVDPNIERIVEKRMMGKIIEDREEDQKESRKKAVPVKASSSKSSSAAKSSSTKRNKVKIVDDDDIDDTIEDEEEEETINSSSSDEESEEDEVVQKKSIKQKARKAAPIRRAPSRRAAATKSKYEFSSDSSDFENSEDDYENEFD